MLIIGIALIICALGLLMAKLTCDFMFTRIEYRNGFVPDYPAYKQISFDSLGHELCGYLFCPEDARALIVFSCGLNSSIFDYSQLIERLNADGFCVFSYDTTGTYNSEGDSSRGFLQAAYDLDAALTFIEDEPILSKLPLYLMGHSQGALAVATALKSHSSVRAAVTVSGINSTLETILYPVYSIMGPLAYWIYPFVFAYQTRFFPSKGVLSRADRAINEVDTPILIIHGECDRVIGYKRGSLMAKRRHIKNPNAEFFLVRGKTNSGHSNLFLSSDLLMQTINFFYAHGGLRAT